MKTIFRVLLWTPESGVRSAEIEADLPFAPSLEMQFVPPVWKNGRKPAIVAFDLEELSFYVDFESDELPNKEALKESCETYRYHGWKFCDEN